MSVFPRYCSPGPRYATLPLFLFISSCLSRCCLGLLRLSHISQFRAPSFPVSILHLHSIITSEQRCVQSEFAHRFRRVQRGNVLRRKSTLWHLDERGEAPARYPYAACESRRSSIRHRTCDRRNDRRPFAVSTRSTTQLINLNADRTARLGHTARQDRSARPFKPVHTSADHELRVSGMDFRSPFSPPAPPPDLSTFDLGPLTPELPQQHGEEEPSRSRPERDRRRRSSFASFMSSAGAPPVIPIERDFGAGVRDTPRSRHTESRDGMRRRTSSSHTGRRAASSRVGEESRRCEFSSFLVRSQSGSTPYARNGSRKPFQPLRSSRWRPVADSGCSSPFADEDFTTIDWVADTLLERSRRRYEKATATRTLGHSVRAGFWRLMAACQSWAVVSLVGEYRLFSPRITRD